MTVARDLDLLNPEQRDAVEHVEGPLLVLAGAGSGKTRVLTTRIAYLIHEQGVDPASIFAVTFTNKAAGEMRERVRGLLGREPAGAWIGTFHAIGARILRRFATRLGWTEHGPGASGRRAAGAAGDQPAGGWSANFSIYDADQSLRQVKLVMERFDLSTKRWHPKAVHAAISSAKNQFVPPDEYAAGARDAFSKIVSGIYGPYQDALRRANAFDFDDLLVKPVELFRAHPDVLDEFRRRFRFVLVDEYQDTNHVQYLLLELLAAREIPAGAVPASADYAAAAAEQPGRRADAGRSDRAAQPARVEDGLGGNLMVVGDDDQSIYGWRGADIRNILDFERSFPDARVIRLERNYRSTARILDAANRVIEQNVRRKGKTLRTDAGPGEPLTRIEAVDERDEADWVVREIGRRMDAEPERSPRDFVVLYRTNAQSRALEDALRRHGLPYQIVGGTRFYERREIMDVVAYLRLISNPLDFAAFDRVVNYPRRGIGDVTRGRLLAWARERDLPALEAAARADECEAIGARARGLTEFATLIERYRGLAAELPVGELVERLIEEIELTSVLQDEGPEGEDRLANVEELVASAHEFDAGIDDEPELEDAPPDATALDLFLQKISLVTTVDRHDPDATAVTLMTLHNAKGLEFPFVFITGLEDGLFPLARAYDEPDELEEERRLFYVGITRAQRKVYLTHARTRRRAGEVLACVPSSFLEPLPPELVEQAMTPALSDSRYEQERRWRRRRRREGRSGRGGFGRRADTGGDGGDGGDGGLVVDYSDAQDTPRFVKGERVRHPQFGSGTIRELSGLGSSLKAVIEFESVGRKKVIVRYANLQKEL